MLKINERNRVHGEDIHLAIKSKNKNYRDWLNDKIEYADLKEEKDFFAILLKSTGGRPKTQYEFTLDAAKEICLLEKNEKAKEIRRWLIALDSKRDNLELITVKEAAFAFKVINCLKYIENQKEAYSLHQKTFVSRNINTLDSRFIYAEFAKARAKITGWSKTTIDESITEYIKSHPELNNTRLSKSDMQTKLSSIDIGEAIRVACLDILFSNEENEQIAFNFSDLCKRMANEMNVEPKKKNENNLFNEKENISTIKMLSKETKVI